MKDTSKVIKTDNLDADNLGTHKTFSECHLILFVE